MKGGLTDHASTFLRPQERTTIHSQPHQSLTYRIVFPSPGDRLQRIGGNSEYIAMLSSRISVGLDNALADSTKRGHQTPIRHWIEYTEKELGISRYLLLAGSQFQNNLPEAEVHTRTAIILGFLVKMVEGHGKGLRGHQSPKTAIQYLQVVKDWHLEATGSPLFPGDAHIKALCKKVVKGLVKVHGKSPSWRRKGLSKAQVLELNRRTRSLKGVMFTYRGCVRTYTTALIDNLCALRIFAWQMLFRLGEATVTDMQKWTADIKQQRMNRGLLSVTTDGSGSLTGYSHPPPGYKCDNLHTDLDLFMPFFPEDDINVGTAINAMLRSDPLESGVDSTEVPLFRFPPSAQGLGLDDKLSNRSLTPEFLTRLDRKLMALPVGGVVFADVIPAKIAGHSYR